MKITELPFHYCGCRVESCENDATIGIKIDMYDEIEICSPCLEEFYKELKKYFTEVL